MSVFVCHDFILDAALDDVQARLERHGIDVVRGPLSRPGEPVRYERETWERYFGAAEVAMFSTRNPCGAELLRWAPRLIGIVNPTIGLDSVDLAAADQLGIIVGHGATPENFNAMAEATVMLMLMLLYQPDASREVLAGRRKRPPPSQAWARSLAGRTVGLVGQGRIGRAVAERLRGWDVRIMAVNRKSSRADLEALLQQSDIVSLHVSLNETSRALIGAREFELMKPGAYLVNTSRGDVVDEEALVRALRERRIAGAALDVFATEPLPAESPLRTLDNVILTPHMVGHTREVFESIGPAAEDNIVRVLRGELPSICWNPHAAYRFRERYRRLHGAAR